MRRTLTPTVCGRLRPRLNAPAGRSDARADIADVGRASVRASGDVLFVNPPTPDGGIWIRSQHRVGRRSRENMIWPQVDLAQMAALLVPKHTVEIVDAVALRMDWPEFELLLRQRKPCYYVTQVTAPTLDNDMRGVLLAHDLGAFTIAFGTHVTPMYRETMERFPALDFVLRGEPELTLQELVSTLEEEARGRSQVVGARFPRPKQEAGSKSEPASLGAIEGLVWRRDGETVVNPDRPFIPRLDDLPLPLHDLLPLDKYRMPMIKGPYSFVVTSRGCPGGCTFCIKHVTYGRSVRIRSPESIFEEILLLQRLGIHDVHMYADLFTVDRGQVEGLCTLILEAGLDLRWTCNSRVDFVDEELLRLMARAGCWTISWGVESGSAEILRRVHKGTDPSQAERALRWARAAGIRNWGYFIIGLPGETEDTIRQTIRFAKALPLDIALFHIAAPYPGTPFYHEVLNQGWFRPGGRWDEVDMDRSTVLDYPNLSAEQLAYWQRRAFREWAFRPGPMWTFLKSVNSPAVLRSAIEIGLQTLGWVGRR
jgi:anaerobic magnesium-protoporphyrin IX monomethyl ester cyclase